ncbi:MAG: hypothetical protein GY941_19250 [Planctomycetes bacterium]|nr:hypothetical protein [Planctomycetota bacterium]
MDNLLKNADKIIKEAAKSKAAMLALMLILLCAAATILFKDASDGTKLAVFTMLLLGVAVFATISFSHEIVPKVDSNDSAKYVIGQISIKKRIVLIVLSIVVWGTAYFYVVLWCVIAADTLIGQWAGFWIYVNHFVLIPVTILLLCVLRPVSPKWAIIYSLFMHISAFILALMSIIYHPMLQSFNLSNEIYFPYFAMVAFNMVIAGAVSRYFYARSAIA